MPLKAHVFEHRFRLASPMGNARALWHERSGLVLTLDDGSGSFGQGEASPLPGYSDHGLEACRDALARLDTQPIEAVVERTALASLGALSEAAPVAPPEVRFAIETAALDLAARRRGVPLFRMLRELMASPAPAGPVPVVALLGPDPAAWVAQSTDAVRAGYAGVKVKIGVPGAVDDELAGLSAVRRVLGPNHCLRLDANGALPRDALEAYARFSPEFVEEPLPPNTIWSAVPLAVPAARDESLRLESPVDEHESVVAWVLKLGPLGGFARCMSLARDARSRAIASVVSHTFEGPIAFAAAVEFALALGPGRFAAGLGTHNGLHTAELPAGHRGSSLDIHSEPGLGVSRLHTES